jgi:hypothetical protein
MEPTTVSRGAGTRASLMVKPGEAGKPLPMHEKGQTRESRKAHNEALFRDANEAVRLVQEELAMPEGLMPFICECDEPECRSVVRMTQAAYEEMRAHSRRFVIARGHTTLGRTVERHAGYCVVEKSGLSAEIAEETDPRRSG